MKKLFFIAVLCSLFAAIGCKNTNTPTEVAKRFFTALNSKDFNTAKEYATKESQEPLKLMESLSSMSKENKKEPAEIEASNEKIDGDRATVNIKDKKTGKLTVANLKKEDSKWKVAFDKGSTMGTELRTPPGTQNMPDSVMQQPEMDSMSKPTKKIQK